MEKHLILSSEFGLTESVRLRQKDREFISDQTTPGSYLVCEGE